MEKFNLYKSLTKKPEAGRGQELFVRIALAIVMLPHGAQLLFGWFGGPGLKDSLGFLTEGAGLPGILAFFVILLQFFGSLFLLVGFRTRLISAFMFIMFIGMIFSGHLEHGFFINWIGNQQGEGIEFHLLALGMSGFLAINGSYAYSLDKVIDELTSKEPELEFDFYWDEI